ncbi:MAG: hypothetical protein U9Q07_09875 [Planctomycetota bacterium]|nr:hypothetical protein [Planctomycetota bacterium]
MSYTVMVDDNFHPHDEDERYELGAFDTLDEAIAACKKCVDEDLEGIRKPGMTAEDLYDHYTRFGSDPFILDLLPGLTFSAWAYAKHRCFKMLP